MPKPLVTFGDATAAVIGILSEGLDARPESFVTGYAIGSRVPRQRSTDIPGLPFVLVALDATPVVTYPINVRSSIRVTVWHESPEEAHDLAQLCHGLVLTYSGGDVLRGIRSVFGVIPGLDEGSGVALATFSVMANVRAIPLD